jgi:hypothetical protein
MKNLLLTLLLTLVSNSALAKWIPLNSDDDETAYVESTEFPLVGDHRKMTVLLDFKTPQGERGNKFLSLKERTEYDCINRKKRYLFTISYDGHMGEGGKDAIDEGSPWFIKKWVPIVPNSNDLLLWEVACDRD